MAAGLGFKTFTTGEVLTAADTNGYLMQGILVFASAAARDAAITSPQEGQFAYLKDTNVTTYYTGSAWANVDTTGMTNPMTTTGDIIYSSPGSTPVRLGIGSTGNVLTVAGGVPSWSAPAGGGKILQVVTTNNNSAKSLSDGSEYTEISTSITPSSASSRILVMVTLGIVSSTGVIDMAVIIRRNSTDLQLGTGGSINATGGGITNQGADHGVGQVINLIDSPASTSSLTYKVIAETSSGSMIINKRSSDSAVKTSSNMILMEIGA